MLTCSSCLQFYLPYILYFHFTYTYSNMPPTTRHWTTALILVLAPFCLLAKFPWQLAFLVPALLVVDLYRRSQRPRREPIRSIGTEKRKVRRLNGRDGAFLEREEVCCIQDCYWNGGLAYAKIINKTRSRWGFSTIINLFLTAAVLDHALTHRFVPCRDVSYARQVIIEQHPSRSADTISGRALSQNSLPE
jgi:hypothetical protein